MAGKDISRPKAATRTGRLRLPRSGVAFVAVTAGVVLLVLNHGVPSNQSEPAGTVQAHTDVMDYIGPKPGTGATTEFVGEVIIVGEGMLVVLSGDTKRVFFCNDETQVTLNHRPARLEDIMPGHAATVFSEKQGDQHIARAVDARMNY